MYHFVNVIQNSLIGKKYFSWNHTKQSYIVAPRYTIVCPAEWRERLCPVGKLTM